MEWFKHFFGEPSFFVRLDAIGCFFGFTEKHLDDIILQNQLLLVSKICLYKSRSYGFVCFKSLILEIKKINRLEKKLQKQMQLSINLTYLNGIKMMIS